MLNHEIEQYDIEAEITLYTPEEGGRKQGFPVEFTVPHIYFNGIDMMARFTLPDCNNLNPGETARAWIVLLFRPHYVAEQLHVGARFLLREGYHPIGYGHVLSIIH